MACAQHFSGYTGDITINAQYDMVPVNYFAVVVVAIVEMLIAAIWYGPLFGKEWSSYSPKEVERKNDLAKHGASKLYIIQGFGAVLTSYMLQHAVVIASAYLLLSGIGAGLLVGSGVWIGFVAPITIGTVLWEGRPWRYWGILAGYYLVAFIVMATILALWR